MARYVMAIDQGTTGSTVSIVDENLEVVATQNQEFEQHYPQPGWVEHKPAEIWESVLIALGKALAEAGIQGSDIAAIGITNQRETSVVWDKETGEAIHNAIVWQCRRTADVCEALVEAGHGDSIRKKTGLVVDAYFSGTKFAWILDHVEGARSRAEAGALRAGTIDTYLVWKLSEGTTHVTDVSNASRTMLMELHSLDWDAQLLEILRVPASVLPSIRSSAEVYGTTQGVPGLPDGIPISGMAGDQQSALFGQACFAPGEGKLTFGTGAFLLVNTGDRPVVSHNKMLTTVAWKIGENTTYALEGSAFVAGAAVQWLRDGLQMIETAPDIEGLAEEVPDTGGVVFVPAFVGLGAPHWRPGSRAAIVNLTRGSTKAHIARACLEGIALQNCDILKAMGDDRGVPVTRLKVDGGACKNNLLMQMQADLAGIEVIRPRHVETTSFGAIFLAGIGAGIWEDTDAISQRWQEDRVFCPEMQEAEKLASHERWNDALERV